MCLSQIQTGGEQGPQISALQNSSGDQDITLTVGDRKPNRARSLNLEARSGYHQIPSLSLRVQSIQYGRFNEAQEGEILGVKLRSGSRCEFQGPQSFETGIPSLVCTTV